MTKVGRNDPCPCGSGRKYKKCHLDRQLTSDPSAQPAPVDFLHGFRVTLSGYEYRDLARGIGALQLVPANAGRTIRLESVAEGIASISAPTGNKLASRHAWTSWLNRGGLVQASTVMLEDPFDNLFTEAVAFIAGSYIVFPGVSEEAVLIMRQICKAIFLQPNDAINGRFRESGFYLEAAQLIQATLAISNTMARRAGYERGMEADDQFASSVVIPDTERFHRLKDAVTFSCNDIMSLVRCRDIEESPLRRLVRTPGEHVTDPAGDPDSLLVGARPILRIGNEFVVIAPGALLGAVRHAVICLAQELGVVDELGISLHAAGRDTLDTLLKHARMDWVPLLLNVDDPPSITRALYRFDSDKLIHAVLLSDVLIDYDPLHVFGRWPCNDTFDHVVASLRTVEQQLFEGRHAPNEVLHLIVFNSLGRSFVAGLTRGQAPTGEILMPRLGDLETLVYVDPEPLAIWKFARAHRQIRDRLDVMQSGLLDEFQAYRRADRSYYLGDEARPNFVWIAGGGAGILRAEVMKRRGFFATTSASRTGITEVTLAHDDHRIPIYLPWPPRRGAVELLTRIGSFNIWVTSPPLDEQPQELIGYYAQFVDFFAYWLWQCSQHLAPSLVVLQNKIDQVRIEVRLIPGEGWRNAQRAMDATRSLVRVGDDTLVMTLGSRVVLDLNTPDNTAERALLRELLAGLRDLATALVPEGAVPLARDNLALIVDHVAPLGTKKKLVIMDASAAPLTSGPEEAPYRVVAQHDESEILDEMGDLARLELGLAVGPLSNDQANALAHAVVDFLYEELRVTVASLDPNDLLIRLVGLNETLVQRQADLNFTIPTRLACFAELDDVVAKIGEELDEATKALTANRFLVEYVSSRPPTGIRPFSESVYDRMLALCSMLIQWGFNSDVIHLGLAPSAVEMLPSGRIGIKREAFSRITKEFREERLIADIEASHRRFPRAWNDGTYEPAKPTLLSRLDRASTAEFGIPITKLGEFLSAILNVCIGLNTRVLSMTRLELTERLRDQLAWNDEELNLAIEFFATRPRPDFQAPPAPYTMKDIYPWRFGRPLSYLRRPIILQEVEQGENVLCGFRNLYLAGGNLIGLILSERMRGRTAEFRALVSEIRNEFSEEFNDDVASAIEAAGRGSVRIRVNKVGTVRLERVPGEDIGDIDVLWLIPEERSIFVIETKSLVAARTPSEMANELQYLFKSKAGKLSGAQKHLERARWIDDHLADVLAWLGLDSSTPDWNKAEPIIVVDRELISDKIAAQTLSVMSFREFKTRYMTSEQDGSSL